MTTKGKLSKLIVLLFKAYDKDADKELAELYHLRLKDLDVELVENRIFEWIDSSRFFPRISDLREFVTKQEDAKEYEFLLRFRRQATSPYPWTELDDDIFTVKRYVGPRQVEDATLKEWPWLEKRVVEVYRLLKLGHLELMENPNKYRVKVLPSGSRYIEQSETQALKSTIAKIGNELPKLLEANRIKPLNGVQFNVRSKDVYEKDRVPATAN